MKKKFPLEVLRQLNKLKNKVPEDTRLAKVKESFLLRYEDLDFDSDFFFEITSFSISQNKIYYSCSRKPTSEKNLGTFAFNYPYMQVVDQIKQWSSMIQAYNETPFFREGDKMVSKYTEEFFEEYKILEDGAEQEPFDLEKQILIDKYLESSLLFLNQYEKENDNFDLTEIKGEAQELKKNLTNLSKNQVVKGLSKFWAKCRSKGLPILKEVFFELAKEIVKELGKKMIGL